MKASPWIFILPAAILFLSACSSSPSGAFPGTGNDSTAFQYIFPDSVACSSYLKNADNLFDENYHPNYLLDKDDSTAWETAQHKGAGENITFYYKSFTNVKQLQISVRNGNQRSAVSFRDNVRPKTIEIYSGNFLLGTVELKDQAGSQEFRIDVKTGVQIKTLNFRIKNIYDGPSGVCCIDELAVGIGSSPATDTLLNAKRKGNLAVWIRERKIASLFLNHGIPFICDSAYHEAKETFHDVLDGEIENNQPIYLLQKDQAMLKKLFGGKITDEQFVFIKQAYDKTTGYKQANCYSPVKQNQIKLEKTYPVYKTREIASSIFVNRGMLVKTNCDDHTFYEEINKASGCWQRNTPYSILSSPEDSALVLYNEWQQHNIIETHPYDWDMTERFIYYYDVTGRLVKMVGFNDRNMKTYQVIDYYEFFYAPDSSTLKSIKRWCAHYQMVESNETTVSVSTINYQ